MEVRPGYKQTEIGVIPEDWEVQRLGDLFAFSGGFPASRAQLSDEGHCYLHYGDIHVASKATIDTSTDLQYIPRLMVPLREVPPRSLLEDGDVVFVDASEDDEGVSKHIVVKNAAGIPFISGLHTIVAKPLTNEISPDYRCYCFQSAAIRQQFLFYAAGTKVKGITKTNIAKLLLPIPPLEEQRAIAAALSDVDALLGALDRLIAKKRDLKQATMQQLLTGQMRLPGFSGEWEVKRLGELGSFLKGNGVKREEANSGDLPCIRYGEIYTHHNDYVRSFYSWISREVAATATRIRRGDLLFAGSGETKEEIGKCVAIVDDREAYAGGDIVILRTTNVDPMFMGYYCNTPAVNAQKSSRGQGDAVVHISAAALASVEVMLPPIAEQTAIAVVLSDMDAEIAALEARRNKTRALKQAMMQELLTGRTRLISEAAPRKDPC